MIERTDPLARIERRFRTNPVVLLGPRQCGKTTLARQFARGRNAEYFDLEAPADAPAGPAHDDAGAAARHRRDRRSPAPARVVSHPARAGGPAAAAGAVPATGERVARPGARRVGIARRARGAGAHERFRLVGGGGSHLRRLWWRGGCPARSWPHPTPKAGGGATTSFRRSWSATCGGWAWRSRRPPCDASGTWWRTIMGRFGTPRKSAARWEKPTTR